MSLTEMIDRMAEDHKKYVIFLRLRESARDFYLTSATQYNTGYRWDWTEAVKPPPDALQLDRATIIDYSYRLTGEFCGDRGRYDIFVVPPIEPEVSPEKKLEILILINDELGIFE